MFQPPKSAQQQNASPELRLPLHATVSSEEDLWRIVLTKIKPEMPISIGRPADLPPQQGDRISFAGNLGSSCLSRQHGEFVLHRQGLYYNPTSPTNPDSLNGKEIRQGCLLMPYDKLTLGDAVTLTVPSPEKMAEILCTDLELKGPKNLREFEQILTRIRQFVAKDNTAIDLGVLSPTARLIFERGMTWYYQPRDTRQIAYLAKLEADPATAELAKKLQLRCHPGIGGDSVLGLFPNKISTERIFREEDYEIVSVRETVKTDNVVSNATKLDPTGRTPGRYLYSDSKSYYSTKHEIVRYLQDGEVKNLVNQPGSQTCVPSCTLMIALDTASKYGIVPKNLAMLFRNTEMSSLSELSVAEIVLSKGFEGCSIVPYLTRVTTPAPLGLHSEIKEHGPAIVSINSPIGGHVIIVDKVNNPNSESNAMVSIRDPYHGWAIEVPWSAFKRVWSSRSEILQVGPKR